MLRVETMVSTRQMYTSTCILNAQKHAYIMHMNTETRAYVTQLRNISKRVQLDVILNIIISKHYLMRNDEEFARIEQNFLLNSYIDKTLSN